VLRVQINNVPSATSGKNLGSILLTDTFLFQEGCFLVLTRDVP